MGDPGKACASAATISGASSSRPMKSVSCMPRNERTCARPGGVAHRNTAANPSRSGAPTISATTISSAPVATFASASSCPFTWIRWAESMSRTIAGKPTAGAAPSRIASSFVHSASWSPTPSNSRSGSSIG